MRAAPIRLPPTPSATGPYEMVAYEAGSRAEVRRREGYDWWAGSPHLDAIEWVDLGTSPVDLIGRLPQGHD